MRTADDSPYWILNEQGDPVKCSDVLTWARWSEENRMTLGRIADTKIGRAWVSTIFLGLDHSFGADGPPVLFESMLFWPFGEWDGLQQRRYCTREEALRGHAEIVDYVLSVPTVVLAYERADSRAWRSRYWKRRRDWLHNRIEVRCARGETWGRTPSPGDLT